VVSVTGPRSTTPGLVRLSAAVAGPGACSASWRQSRGPATRLRFPHTLAPSFVARTAGVYAFDVVASCGAERSEPARVEVTVENVPPVADAGRVVVVSPGAPVRLDALASSDANGDALALAWDQTLGPPVTGTEQGGTLALRARAPGLYAFQVTATDGGGLGASAEVPVVVAAGMAPTAIAAALPSEAEVGATVVLDASASVGQQRGAAVAAEWRQVEGPAAELAGAGQVVASFTPARPGRYAFEAVVGEGRLRSPPARVEVFVAEADGSLPVVTATAPAVVAVDAPLELAATATGDGALAYAWRQVSGPAAGLTDADRPTAVVVPFAPGFHVFEVSARSGDVEGRPARVAFEARAGRRPIPVARVTAPVDRAWVGQLVLLDGRASAGAARFRWTQVAGPWVPLAGDAIASFRARVEGRYAFELEVDDGAARSAPARVEIEVVAGGVR
jgi:hypothetical protein